MSVELDKVSVIRNGRPILNAATIACDAGAFTALCGPNGAGKTTALSVMTGALEPDEGRVRLDGEDVGAFDRLSLARRRAVVSQSSALSFPFQAHEVAAMGRAPHHGRAGQSRDAAVISAVIAAMDLTAMADRNYLTLSGGERQRVNIARALAQIWDPPDDGQARWLFLDEPTAALDLKHQIALMVRLKALAREGWGVVAVLHDLPLVRQHADKVVLFKDGEIHSAGAPADMLTPDRIQTVFDLAAPYTATAEPF
ncbi:MAG: heme ABC transporter ATP-binding protein [Pseudomonadota bacterium]